MTVGNYLARAAFTYALARATRKAPAELFKTLYPTDKVAPAVFNRAAQTIGTTTGSHWADDLVQTAVADFLASLAPQSAAAALMRGPNAMTVDVANTINALKLPMRSTAPAAPPWIQEGGPIPVKSYTLANVDLGPARKLGAMVVMSRELLKRTDGERIFGAILREDAAAGLDAAVFSDASGSGDAIAGLLNGATSVSGTGDPLRDLKALAIAVSTGGSGQVTFVAGPAMAAALSLDPMIRATILPSTAVPETRLVAVDPMSLAWGADPEPSLDVSNEAVLHMSDDPLPISASGTADPVRSLWQTDAIATRLILELAFVKRRAPAAAYMDSVSYAA